MTDSGYIKLHRAIQGWEWYSDGVTFRVFVYLLLNANWEDSRYRGHEVPKGSLVTSYGSIARALKISVKNARTAMEHLKATGEVATKTASKFQVVTIVNWDKYQCTPDESGRQNGSQTAGKWQASGNIKEYKEYKNIKKRDNTTPNGKPSYTPEFFAELEREVKEK